MTSARICLYLEYTQCGGNYTQLPAAVQKMSPPSSPKQTARRFSARPERAAEIEHRRNQPKRELLFTGRTREILSILPFFFFFYNEEFASLCSLADSAI